jgi:hypothetical protein
MKGEAMVVRATGAKPAAMLDLARNWRRERVVIIGLRRHPAQPGSAWREETAMLSDWGRVETALWWVHKLHSTPETHRLSDMKTMTVRDAKQQLGKLVEKVQHAPPVILVQGDKLAKLERYDLLDPECDSPQLQAMLLEAVRGPHAPYSRKELEAILEKVIRDSPGE